MKKKMAEEQDARYGCHHSLCENKNNPLPKWERFATVPNAYPQRYPEQQEQRRNHSMRRSVAERMQPQNQAKPAAEYRPSREDAPKAKSSECVHKTLAAA